MKLENYNQTVKLQLNKKIKITLENYNQTVKLKSEC